MNPQPYASETRSFGTNFKACKRILFLGNSISLHGRASEIGWTHSSGMATISAPLIQGSFKALSQETK
jgi:hypothetical protein